MAENESVKHISSKIFKKIQELSKNTEFNLQPLIIGEEIKIGDEIKPGVFQEINSQIKIIEECQNDTSIDFQNNTVIDFQNDTSIDFQKNFNSNQIGNVVKEISKNFGEKALVFSFSKNYKTSKFSKAQVYKDAEFNMKQCLEIVKTCRLWLLLDKENKIIIEMKKGKEPEVIFFLCCILSHCKYFNSGLKAFENLILKKIIKINLCDTINLDKKIGKANNRNLINLRNTINLEKFETIKRYIEYFDNLYKFSESTKINQRILNQLIITTIPSIIDTDDFRPILEIKYRGNSIIIEDGHFYKDSDFVIFSCLNQILMDDFQISIFFEKENTKYHIFNLQINSLFYEQGLYRFTRSQIDTTIPFSDKFKYFKNDFSLDLIFIENYDSSFQNPFSLKMDLIQDMISMSSNMPSSSDAILYDKLISLSFNPAIAKFCWKMNYSFEDCNKLIGLLEERGYKNLIYNSNPVCASKNTKNDEKDIFEDDLEILEIEKIIERNIKKYSKFRNRSFLRKSQNQILHIPQKIIAVKTLHWTPIYGVEGTIFEAVKNIKININYSKFEQNFCKSKNVKLDKKEEVKVKTVCDSRRSFLVSLAMKHLQLKNINSSNIENIIDFHSSKLTLQDLYNIKCVLPTENEWIHFVDSKESDLIEIEKEMLKLTKMPEILYKVNLLEFRMKFADELQTEIDFLRNFQICLTNLLDSENFRKLIKILIELGNALNHKYSLQSKYAEGFRIESLNSFSVFSHHGRTLIEFVKDLLKENNANVQKELIELKKYQKIDMNVILASVNNCIDKYNERHSEFINLSSKNQVKFKKFFGFASHRLKEMIDLFHKTDEICNQFQEFYCGDKKKPIGLTISIMYNFGIQLNL